MSSTTSVPGRRLRALGLVAVLALPIAVGAPVVSGATRAAASTFDGAFANVNKAGALVGSFNSSGGAVTATRLGTGRYRVRMAGVDATRFAAASTFDNTGSGRTCKVEAVAGTDATVRCSTRSGADVDSGFTVAAGRTNYDDTRVVRTAAGRWVSRTGLPVTRVSVGTFDVDIDLTLDYDWHDYGHEPEFGAVALGAGKASCAAVKRTQLHADQPRFRYRVVCSGPYGANVDADFVVWNYYRPQNDVGFPNGARGGTSRNFTVTGLGGGRFRYTSKDATYSSLTTPAVQFVLTAGAGVRCVKSSEAVVAHRLVAEATCRRLGSSAVVTTAPLLWFSLAVSL